MISPPAVPAEGGGIGGEPAGEEFERLGGSAASVVSMQVLGWLCQFSMGA
jgi:hypothetical protein